MQTTDELSRRRFHGCLLAGACGDALGAPVEFMNAREIVVRFGVDGITEFVTCFGKKGAITDDTQMTLFSLEGLLRATVRYAHRGICHPASVVHGAYRRWYRTQSESFPETERLHSDGWLISHRDLWSRRSPGVTCMSALRESVSLGTPAINNSKGCGGVMRAAPAGLIARDPFTLGCEMSALTHGHLTGILAAGAFAQLIGAIVHAKAGLNDALDMVEQRLSKVSGHEESLAALRLARKLAHSSKGAGIPAALARAPNGGGWVAEEALAIAVFCCLAEDDPEKAVIRAVNHDGDSDSTGAIAGNIVGALFGDAWIPKRWLEQLELAEVIRTMADDAYNSLSGGEAAIDELAVRYPGG